MNSVDEPLVQAAVTARDAAYAPYSNFLVGAALRLVDGSIVTGVNVENSSYGLSICAERSALVEAVRRGLRVGGVAAVAVVALAPQPVSPCGACRQVLAEFAPPATPVYLHNLQDGRTDTTTVGILLPLAFGPAHLQS